MPEILKTKLNNLLYEEGPENLSIQSVNVTCIEPGCCPKNSISSSEKGPYVWEETTPSQTANVKCNRNPQQFATRFCNISITNTAAQWEDPDLDFCQPIIQLPDTIQELQTIVVTPENAKEFLEHIFNLTNQCDTISSEETDIILSKLSEIVSLAEMNHSRAQTSLDIMNIIFTKVQDLRPFTSRILNVTENIGYKMSFAGAIANVTAQTLVLSISKVNFQTFEDMFFTVASYLEGKEPEITQDKIPSDKAVAYVYLPRTIQEHAVSTISKVQFNFFGKTKLFEDNNSSKFILNTYVVSASVANSRMQDLRDPVDITLRHIQPNTEKKPVQCVFWDFNLNNGSGGWSGSGCKVTLTRKYYTTCHCNHLTHFGVLLDLSRTEIDPLNEHILSILSYVGCGTASVFLGIALVTYLAFEPLRKDYPSKILMNLSSALLMLNLIFLLNNWLSSFRNYGLCISCAALLHYFLLASFTWMGLEAVHMYFALVKVFNVYVHNYILKFCIAGWGIPTIIVAILLIVNKDFYGTKSSFQQYSLSTNDDVLFCWIKNDLVFYLTVVSYFCVMFLTNLSMFIVVILQINSIKSKRMKSWKTVFLHDVKSTISLAFLLGLTWGFAFFAWGPVEIAFLYLFAIFNTLQGFFIFVFHCLMKENVRKQWRIHLCCGRFRLDNFSDWSRLSNVEVKQNGQAHKVPSICSNTTHSTTLSSDSRFSRDPSSERNYGNGGIFMNPAVTTKQRVAHPVSRRDLSFLEQQIQ
ncbi:adhesion G-protein coupled receptor G4 [Discoglossus pictus]